jgi:hypothetical protein
VSNADARFLFQELARDCCHMPFVLNEQGSMKALPWQQVLLFPVACNEDSRLFLTHLFSHWLSSLTRERLCTSEKAADH